MEIEGTEPYIVGGHTASGYWVDTKRATTIEGLYAAGDVAGGCPQKYVTGALAEGEIAAKSSVEYINAAEDRLASLQGARNGVEAEIARHVAEIETYLSQKNSLYTTELHDRTT